MTSAQTESFVPLTAASLHPGDRQEFRVTVLTESEAAQRFKVLDTEPTATATASGVAVKHGKNCEPQVSIQREGDQVTGIRIQCGCGQVIDLACVY